MVAEAYAAELIPMFEMFSAEALKLAGVTSGMKIVDVATGPGTLALMAASKGAKVTALDFSPAMIQQLQVRAGRANATIDTQSGDGQRLLFPSDHFERAFSMFGLMFFPDRGAGFRELLRVLVPGGRAVVASWAPATGGFALVTESLRTHMPAAGPGAPAAPPSTATPLSDPQTFAVELAAAGFSEVAVNTVSHKLKIPSSEAFWATMQRSSAPVVLVRRKMGEAAWAPIAAAVQADLDKGLGKGPREELVTAHLGTGVKAD
jgi:ubiquinone/menaquinone biosynthesis C-methylase UbiE